MESQNKLPNEELLSVQEEAALIKEIQAHPEEAEAEKEKLLRANLRFVRKYAQTYIMQHHQSELSLNDLIKKGNEGILAAAMKFDETQGYKFISYAIWWIRQSVLNAESATK